MRVERMMSAAAVSIAAAVGLAFIHPFGNPRSTPEEPRTSLLRGTSVSEGARTVLVNKCADCHSDATHRPVYANLAPVSWMVERDVMEGRKHLNLSHWVDLSEDRREVLSTEIVSETRKGAMPPLQYRLIHRAAELTPEDIALLSSLAPRDASSGEAGAGDATRGSILFEKRCTGCHSIESNLEGPRLRGVYGRTAGTVPDFAYSSAIQQSGLIWNDANLDRWLRDSDEMLPQSAMGFAVSKPQDRADLVAFLKLQK